MKRWGAIAAGLLTVLGAVGWYVLSGTDGVEAEVVDPGEQGRLAAEGDLAASDGARAALQSLFSAAIPERSGAATIRGRVTAKGAAVAGATVVATVGKGGDILSDRKCQCDEKCHQKLLECGCGHAARQLLEVVGQREGEAPPMARATSAADGSFELTGLEPGVYALWAEHPVSGSAVVPGVRAGTQDTSVGLVEGIFVAGKVVGSDEKPVAGALVTAILAVNSRFFEAVSDGQGAFRIGPVPKGDYTLVASKEGLLPTRGSTKDRNDRKGGELQLVLETPRSVSGVVTQGGKLVAGARVSLEGGHERRSDTSDAAGAFRLTGLRSGSYRVEAALGAQVATEDVWLERKADATEVELELAAGAVVEGTVRDAAGAPIAEVQVNASGRGAKAKGSTDAQGRFRLTVPAGRYWVEASAKGYLPPVPSTGAEAVENRGRELAAGERAVFDFVLEKGVTVRGSAADGAGNALAEVELELSQSDLEVTAAGASPARGRKWSPGSRASGRSEEDGTFALEGLRPGKYVLTATHPRFRPWKRELEVPAQDVRVLLSGGAAVSGRVVDEQGLAQGGARLNLMPDVDLSTELRNPERFNGAKEAEANEQGEFSLEGVEDGKYVLVASVRDRQRLSLRSATQRLVVSRQESVRVELALEAGLPLSGRVVDGQGRPIPGARVTASPSQTRMKLDVVQLLKGGSMASAETGPDGAFSLEHLAPGEYQLFASKEGLRPAGDVRTPAKAGDRDVRLVLEALQRLTGRVIDGAGKPVTDFTVNGAPQHSATGEFELPRFGGGSRQVHIPGGEADGDEVQLVVSAKGFAPALRKLSAGKGDVRVPDIVLTRGRSVEVTVVDAATGEPLAGVSAMGLAEAQAPRGGREAKPLTTDSRGRVRLSNLDEEAATFALHHPDYLPYDSTIPAGQSTFTAKLRRGAVVRGRVLDAAGKPVGSVSIEAMSLDGHGGDFAESIADGTFELKGLPPGKYRLTARADDERTFAAQTLDVPAEGARAELRERQGVEVRVRVRDSDGAPVLVGALLVPGDVPMPASMADWGQLAGSAIRANLAEGKPLLRAVPPGRYTLFVQEPSATGLGLHRQAAVISASPGQELEVQLPAKLTVLERERP